VNLFDFQGFFYTAQTLLHLLRSGTPVLAFDLGLRSAFVFDFTAQLQRREKKYDTQEGIDDEAHLGVVILRQKGSRDGACQTTGSLARPDEGAQVGRAIDGVLARLDDQNRVSHNITECDRHCRQKSANGGKSNRLVCKNCQEDHGNDLSQSTEDQIAFSPVAKERHVIADEAEEDLAAPWDVDRRNKSLQATRFKEEYALKQVLNRQVEQNARTLVEVLKSCLVQESAIKALEEACVGIRFKILVHRLATLL